MLFEKKVFAPIVTNSQICETVFIMGFRSLQSNQITLKYDFSTAWSWKTHLSYLIWRSHFTDGLNVWLTCFCDLCTLNTPAVCPPDRRVWVSHCVNCRSPQILMNASPFSASGTTRTHFLTQDYMEGNVLRIFSCRQDTSEFSWFSTTVEGILYRHCDYMTEEQESWRFHSTRDKKNLLQTVKPFHCLSSSNLLSVQKQIGTCKIKVDMWRRCLCIHQWLNLLTSFSSLLSDKVHSYCRIGIRNKWMSERFGHSRRDNRISSGK